MSKMSSDEFQETVVTQLADIRRLLVGDDAHPEAGLIWRVKEIEDELQAMPCSTHNSDIEKLKSTIGRAVAAMGVIVLLGSFIASSVWQWLQKKLGL